MRVTTVATMTACLSALTVGPSTPAAAAPTCAGLPVTILGTPGDDVIEGTDGADVILARSGDDVVHDRGGHDVVCAGPGTDAFHSGPGDDILRGGDDDDVLTGGPGRDTLLGGEGRDWADSSFASLWPEDPVEGTDEYRLGPGDDFVRLDARLGSGFEVFGGPGEEDLEVRAVPGLPVSVIAGPGMDMGWLIVHADQSTAVTVHQSSQVLRIGDGPRGRVAQWEGVFLSGDHSWSYRGTAAEETLWVPRGRVTAFLYGGNDLVTVEAPGPHFLDGGAGSSDLAQGYIDEGTGTICRRFEVGECGPPP